MATLDAPLSHAELAAMLAEDERMALSFRDSTLADEQAVAIDYYEARPFGDEEEGLSQVVTPEVAEVVDYMTISVSRTIVAGDRVVEFESAEADSEAAAEEATASVTYSFMKSQDGYRVIHDWIQSGLIEKIGIAKTCAETHAVTRKHRGHFDEEQLALLHASAWRFPRRPKMATGHSMSRWSSARPRRGSSTIRCRARNSCSRAGRGTRMRRIICAIGRPRA